MDKGHGWKSAESDPEFRESIARTSLLSLRTVGALEVVVPLLMLIASLSVIPVPLETGHAWLPNVLFAVLGAATLALGWMPAGRRFPRFATAASIWVSAGIIIWSAFLLAEQIGWVEHHVL